MARATAWEEWVLLHGEAPAGTKAGVYRDPAHGGEEEFYLQSGDDFVWCLHCEQAFRVREARLMCGLWMCKNGARCGGDMMFDFWPWGAYRREHPGAPEIPSEGTEYPLYPVGGVEDEKAAGVARVR